MQLPIRNKSKQTLTIFVEPYCNEYEVPVGGEAIVQLEDGPPHSLEVDDGWVTVWDEGGDATVEVLSESDKSVDEALMLVRVWLYRLGARDEVTLLDDTIGNLQPADGYLKSRAKVFGAFHRGFRNHDENGSTSTGADGLETADLAQCRRVGERAAGLNVLARREGSFPELGGGPFDTDTAKSAFDGAARVFERLEERT